MRKRGVLCSVCVDSWVQDTHANSSNSPFINTNYIPSHVFVTMSLQSFLRSNCSS
jgi:hypothetical protein